MIQITCVNNLEWVLRIQPVVQSGSCKAAGGCWERSAPPRQRAAAVVARRHRTYKLVRVHLYLANVHLVRSVPKATIFTFNPVIGLWVQWLLSPLHSESAGSSFLCLFIHLPVPLAQEVMLSYSVCDIPFTLVLIRMQFCKLRCMNTDQYRVQDEKMN